MPIERLVAPPPMPRRPREGHKGLFGRVLVVGGSDSMIGAPMLAGTAALRAGAGLAQVAMPRAILAAALSITPELIGLPLLGKASGKDELLSAAESADAVVLGPGLGRSPEARNRVTRLIRLVDKPMVVDADALNILSEQKRWPTSFRAKGVLTPHPGEMARLQRLLGRSGAAPPDDGNDVARIDLALEAAGAFRQIIVLKGSRTVVAESGEHPRLFVNRTGDSSLSKAGSGDVLSGILGTFLAQGRSPFDAACLSVALHGMAGEAAGKRIGMRSALARDVIDSIPQAISEYERRFGGA